MGAKKKPNTTKQISKQQPLQTTTWVQEPQKKMYLSMTPKKTNEQLRFSMDPNYKGGRKPRMGNERETTVERKETKESHMVAEHKGVNVKHRHKEDMR